MVQFETRFFGASSFHETASRCAPAVRAEFQHLNAGIADMANGNDMLSFAERAPAGTFGSHLLAPFTVDVVHQERTYRFGVDPHDAFAVERLSRRIGERLGSLDARWTGKHAEMLVSNEHGRLTRVPDGQPGVMALMDYAYNDRLASVTPKSGGGAANIDGALESSSSPLGASSHDLPPPPTMLLPYRLPVSAKRNERTRIASSIQQRRDTLHQVRDVVCARLAEALDRSDDYRAVLLDDRVHAIAGPYCISEGLGTVSSWLTNVTGALMRTVRKLVAPNDSNRGAAAKVLVKSEYETALLSHKVWAAEVGRIMRSANESSSPQQQIACHRDAPSDTDSDSDCDGARGCRDSSSDSDDSASSSDEDAPVGIATMRPRHVASVRTAVMPTELAAKALIGCDTCGGGDKKKKKKHAPHASVGAEFDDDDYNESVGDHMTDIPWSPVRVRGTSKRVVATARNTVNRGLALTDIKPLPTPASASTASATPATKNTLKDKKKKSKAAAAAAAKDDAVRVPAALDVLSALYKRLNPSTSRVLTPGAAPATDKAAVAQAAVDNVRAASVLVVPGVAPGVAPKIRINSALNDDFDGETWAESEAAPVRAADREQQQWVLSERADQEQHVGAAVHVLPAMRYSGGSHHVVTRRVMSIGNEQLVQGHDNDERTAAPPKKCKVRFLHACPTLGSVSVRVNDKVVVESSSRFDFGSVSAYIELASDSGTVTIKRGPEERVAETTFSQFAAYTTVAFVAPNKLELINDTACMAEDADDIAQMEGSARVRVYRLTSDGDDDARSFDVSFVSERKQLAAVRALRNRQSDVMRVPPAGKYTIDVQASGASSDATLASVRDKALYQGNSYSVFVVGGTGGRYAVSVALDSRHSACKSRQASKYHAAVVRLVFDELQGERGVLFATHNDSYQASSNVDALLDDTFCPEAPDNDIRRADQYGITTLKSRSGVLYSLSADRTHLLGAELARVPVSGIYEHPELKGVQVVVMRGTHASMRRQSANDVF